MPGPPPIEQFDADKLLVQGKREEAAGLRIIARVLAWRIRGERKPGAPERQRLAYLHCLHGLTESLMWAARVTPREGGADVELCGETLTAPDPGHYWPAPVWDVDIVRRRWWYVHMATRSILLDIYNEWRAGPGRDVG